MSRVLDTAMTKAFDEFATNLKKLEKLTMDDSGRIIWKYSSQFAGKLVRYTQPAKGAGTAKKIGDKAVTRDISRVYVNPANIYLEIKKQSENVAKLMWSQYKNSDIEGFRATVEAYGGQYKGIQIRNWDDGKAHKRARNNRGRVSSNAKAKTLIEYNDRDEIKSYIKRVTGRVGYLKAGWISGFSPPTGIRGVPKWVKDNRGNHGFVQNQMRSGVTRLLIFNHTSPHIRKLFWERGLESSMKTVTRSMGKEIEKLVVKSAQKV